MAHPVDDAASDTRERILDATIALLRRHGPEKTRVVDVARALGMSHANVYRHFASRDALFDAVTQRWLGVITDKLARIVEKTAPAPERLERWMLDLMRAKQSKVHDDPELFAAYSAIAGERRAVVDAHLQHLNDQVAKIIADGVKDGDFAVKDPRAAARLALTAMISFHHPMLVLQAGDRDRSDDARATIRLIIAGLRAGRA